jgi:wyosine [tRNA(Phe)-imidazoG37] synthetase (radical SAM superfamily)
VRDAPLRIRAMSRSDERHVYGPVSSRRLGRSLGIDLIPYKTCSYDCIYCQLGRTTGKTLERKVHVAPERIFADLERKLSSRPEFDYIGLAGSGEPTLHALLGPIIRGIKERTEKPVAVLTNGSLLGDPDVQDDLGDADLVLPSLDAGDARLFTYVNRPHPEIGFERVVEGMIGFRARFRKPLWMEVMLLGGVTGLGPEVEKIAALCRRIRPDRVQLNTVARPPAEDYAFPVPAGLLTEFCAFFEPKAEVIAERRLSSDSGSRDAIVPDEDILDLVRRRPSTAFGISAGLGIHVNEAVKRLEALEARGEVRSTVRGSVWFYEAVRPE